MKDFFNDAHRYGLDVFASDFFNFENYLLVN